MLNRQFDDQPREDEPPQFVIGQLVQHKRYGYRGVVVDFDMSCEANEAWYQKNQTQPNRDQPWYHVLVNETASATYAAQSSLIEDDTKQPIEHPLLEMFFDQFTVDRYLRNDTPWPS